jgi:hypothetical protein
MSDIVPGRTPNGGNPLTLISFPADYSNTKGQFGMAGMPATEMHNDYA